MQDQQDLQELNVLEKIQVNLPPFYLTESLDSDSLKKVLESSDILLKEMKLKED
jgi:hypothetical protein